jgi:hypothetical protein
MMFGDASLEGGYKSFREDIKNIVPDSRENFHPNTEIIIVRL